MQQLELFDARLFEVQEGTRLHNGYPDYWVEIWREYDDGSLFYWKWCGSSGYTTRQRLAEEGYFWKCYEAKSNEKQKTHLEKSTTHDNRSTCPVR